MMNSSPLLFDSLLLPYGVGLGTHTPLSFIMEVIMYDLTEEVYEVLLDDFNNGTSLYYEMFGEEGVSGKDLIPQPSFWIDCCYTRND